MYEVKKVKDKATLIDLYVNLFRTRFGMKPIFRVDTANEVFNWSLEEFGFDESERFLKEFVALKDDWLKDQGYPLEQFRRTINKLIVQRKPVGSGPATTTRGPKIRLEHYCSHCNEKSWAECFADQLSSIVCEKCQSI